MNENLLGELRSAGRLESEGRFSRDVGREYDLAKDEAGSAEGALSAAGFGLIRKTLDPLFGELARLAQRQSGHPVPWDYSPAAERREVLIRSLASEWAERLGRLVPRLQTKLARERVVQYPPGERRFPSLDEHITNGLWLAAAALRLEPYTRPRGRSSRMPQWAQSVGAEGKRDEAVVGAPRSYVSSVAKRAREFDQALADPSCWPGQVRSLNVLRTAIENPFLDCLAVEGSDFPAMRRLRAALPSELLCQLQGVHPNLYVSDFSRYALDQFWSTRGQDEWRQVEWLLLRRPYDLRAHKRMWNHWFLEGLLHDQLRSAQAASANGHYFGLSRSSNDRMSLTRITSYEDWGSAEYLLFFRSLVKEE